MCCRLVKKHCVNRQNAERLYFIHTGEKPQWSDPYEMWLWVPCPQTTVRDGSVEPPLPLNWKYGFLCSEGSGGLGPAPPCRGPATRQLSSQVNWAFSWSTYDINPNVTTLRSGLCCRKSVCRLSVCLSSVTFVRPSEGVKTFGNISSAFCTLVIRWRPCKILRRSSQGNAPSGR